MNHERQVLLAAARQREIAVDGEAIARAVRRKLSVFKFSEAAERADPKVSLNILVNRSHKIVRQSVDGRVNIELFAPQAT